MKNPPRNLNDLLNTAARALDKKDTDTLEQLKRISEDWLQDSWSKNAQTTLLDAMINAAEEIVDLEESLEMED